MNLKKLPIGIQSFNEIIENDYTYIDKTKHALGLINTFKYVFLSRPRRFGKSLFIDTLYNIFTGNKELFKGLYIYDKYDFEPYPVIRITWSGSFTTQEEFVDRARKIMYLNAERLQIECTDTDPSSCFEDLIRKSYEKYGKGVVILIDEYDKPILDNIGDIEEAKKRRNLLRGIYVQMKENDRYIRFVFLTGISKFSKASIFSGLNNIEDITLNPEYATICGYTHYDLQTVFAEHLKKVDIQGVKEWYNGYNFLGENVYNPFDVLLFIRNHFKYRSYWWSSGTPFSLIELLKKNRYYLPELQNLIMPEVLLDSFDIEDLQLEPLLLQSGYLTIDKEIVKNRKIYYKLRIPNMEVQISLNELFAKYLTERVNYKIQDSLFEAFDTADLERFKQALVSLFASIPYTNYVNNTISSYEGYYASVVYTYLAAIGFRLIAEDVTDLGRIDLTVLTDKNIYIIEFKVGDKDALEQIKQKKYHEKYLSQRKNIYIVGINFDDKIKNISEFGWEKL